MTTSTIAQLPPEVRIVCDHYLAALDESRIPVFGVYLYGSLCLGGFDARSSDIDLLVLTPHVLSPAEIDRLRHLHVVLEGAIPMADRLDITYLPLPYATLEQTSGVRYPVVRDGAFVAEGTGDVNAVTWWQIHHQGLVLYGPPPEALEIPASWDAVEATMHDNLVRYWPARASDPGRFLDAFWVQFAVTTLCRILTTLEAQQIEAKDAALERWALNLPPRWHRLLGETRRIRHAPHLPSLYSAPDARAQDVREFLTYVQARSMGDAQRGSSVIL